LYRRSVCLLIALSGVVTDAPLIVAANRDELYERPAVAMTVLREANPRILGGRDELAGGTWLAVNEHGVVAGLTNQPSPAGRDLTKRSRGELPLAFAAWRTAAEAVERVTDTLDPARYNPCWMLVGDREALYSVGLTGGHHAEVERLAPGPYILENAPLRVPSAKVDRVTALLTDGRELSGLTPGEIGEILEEVLGDHTPASATEIGPGGRPRPAETTAACVHTERYGTRSALIVTVPAVGQPRLRVADGPPCEVPLLDVTSLWDQPALA
jgi:uncharacterized protein with NRDE domain